MTQFQKPLVQANGCIQYPLAMQCAICFFHLRVASLAVATFFARALLPVLLLLLPAMQVSLSLPRVLPRAFARNPNFAIEFAARVFTPAMYLLVFFATDVAITFAPVSFFHPFHVALQIATAIAIAIAFALKVAIFVAIKFGRLIEHCS